VGTGGLTANVFDRRISYFAKLRSQEGTCGFAAGALLASTSKVQKFEGE